MACILWSNRWADRRQAFAILIYARIWPSTLPSSHFQGHRKVLFKASSESLELQVFTTLFIEFALNSGSNAIFLEHNLDVLDQWFEVEQMDSRITSWWTMRINKHVIFSDWWISRSKCQHDQRSFTYWFSFRNNVQFTFDSIKNAWVRIKLCDLRVEENLTRASLRWLKKSSKEVLSRA